MMRLYHDLAAWYWLLDPTEDHADEAAAYQAALEGALGPGQHTLLELGAGAGNNASFMKQRFRCTLTDLSAEMLDLSRQLNPDCEHIQGDMRTLRLGRVFDAVLIHDAIAYMTTEADLRAAAQTAFDHLRPGGAAVFAPDCTRETFCEHTELIENDNGETGPEARALRLIEWSWDPDASDGTTRAEYAGLLRHGDEMILVHDRHLEGLFSRATWMDVLKSVGFEVEVFERPIEGDGPYDNDVFLCRKP
jgi:SAM-dependent methyltransferase